MHHCLLEKLERGLSAVIPMEPFLGQELGERLGENPIVGDELAVIAGEPEEPAQFGGIAGHGPVVLLASVAIPSLEMMWPKYSMLG